MSTGPDDVQPPFQAKQDTEFWRAAEFSPLVNHEDLRRVTQQDPWQYEVASNLRNFLFNMESRKLINFRVSGIVLHSASVICRVKSQTMVQKGNEIQDALVEPELSPVDDGEPGDGPEGCPIDKLLDSGEDMTVEGAKRNLGQMLDAIATGKDLFSRMLTKEALSRFAMPQRVVAKPLTMSDLSIALNDALKGKFRRKSQKAAIRDVLLPEAITNSYSDDLKIDHLIETITSRIGDQFAACSRPVLLAELFDQKTIIYVVKTFMAILHMINRKLVEAWQATSGEILIVPFGKAGEFFSRE